MKTCTRGSLLTYLILPPRQVRDRPTPYDEGGTVFRRRNPHDTAARGPVPREHPVARSMARGTGPRPTMKGDRFSTQKPSRYRSAGACPPRTAGRPRHGEGQALALRRRGSRFLTKKPSQYRSAGACPPRTAGGPRHGEGQALALRGRGPFFDAEALPVP